MKITYLIPDPSSDGGMTAITKMFYQIGYFDNKKIFHLSTSFQYKKRLLRLLEFPLKYFRFIIHLITVKPDIIFVMSNSYFGFYEKCFYCLTAKVFGVKSMLNHVGGEFEKFYNSSALNKHLVRYMIKQPSALLIGSNYWSNYFKQEFPSCKVYNSPNPIISSDYQGGEKVAKKDKFIITSLFRLVKEKGTEELIQVIHNICNKHDHIEFVIMGTGPMLNHIREQLKEEINQNKVRVLGFVDDETKIKEIINCNLYLMLTYFDLMPISIMEAMAASKPIISTKVGGIPDLVEDNYNGYLVNPKEVDAVVEKIEHLTLNHDECIEMGNRSREIVLNNFDIKNIIKKHHDYAEIIINQ